MFILFGSGSSGLGIGKKSVMIRDVNGTGIAGIPKADASASKVRMLASKERMLASKVRMLGESFAFATRNESLAFFVCLVKVINAQACPAQTT